MKISNIAQYRKYIAAQTRIETIRDLIEGEVTCGKDEEMDEYLNHAEYLLRTLVEILNERAKSCIETEITPSQTTKKAPKHDKRIEAYLDIFDEFCDVVMERYDGDVIENITSAEMISLYQGFLTALSDIEKAIAKVEKSA